MTNKQLKENKELTHLHLDKAQKQALKELAQSRSADEQARVSMADLVREAVDIFLASKVRILKQVDMTHESQEARS